MKGESLLGWTPMEAVAVKGGAEPGPAVTTEQRQQTTWASPTLAHIEMQGQLIGHDRGSDRGTRIQIFSDRSNRNCHAGNAI